MSLKKKKLYSSCNFLVMNLTELLFFIFFTNKDDKRGGNRHHSYLLIKKKDMIYNSDICYKLKCQMWYEIKFFRKFLSQCKSSYVFILLVLCLYF